jgi:elongation factor Tu
MDVPKEFRARIHVLSTAEGGRRNPLYTGYRAGLFLGSNPIAGNDGIMTLEGLEQCEPGEDCIARIALLHPELVHAPLHPQTAFELKEGGRLVGTGTILEIVAGDTFADTQA